MSADAMQDLSRVERQIEKLIRAHGAAVVRRHFAKLPVTNWPTWQRVRDLIERYAKKARVK